MQISNDIFKLPRNAKNLFVLDEIAIFDFSAAIKKLKKGLQGRRQI